MIGKQRRDVENGGSLMRKGSKRKKKGLFILRRKGAKLCIGFVLLYSLWVIGVYSRMKINNDARIKDEVKMMKSTNAKKKFIKNELPSFEELFGKDDDDADVNVLGFGTFSRIERKALTYERRRIYNSETKIMRQDEMKTRNTNTGKWKMLSKPRELNSTEMRGYVNHIESEEARAKSVLKTLQAMKCESERECEKVVEELVMKTIDGFKKSEKLFVDHEVVSSINLSNRAFGSRNAEKAILTLSGGDREQLKMLGLDEEKMDKFRGKGRKRDVGGKRTKECAVVGNGPISGNDRREGEEDVEDVEEEDNNNNNYDINNIGQTIDSHDVVFRVNQGPVGGRYEEKVGAKTDFRVLNNAWAEKYGQESALGEKLREAVETDETVISTRASAERFYALAKQFRRHKRGVELHPPWMASDRVQSDVRKLLEKVRAVKTRIIVMRENESPEEVEREHEDKKHVIMHGGTTPSTGILAIFLALASGCDIVDPYGFSFGRGGRFSGGNSMKTYHYFADKESFHNPTHSYALEGEILRVVKRLGF